MERPGTTEYKALNLDELAAAAAERDGENALYTYEAKSGEYTMPLKDTLEVCGQHIATLELPMGLFLLDGLLKETEKLSEEELAENIQRAQQFMAKRALAQVVTEG